MKRIVCFGDSLTWGFTPVTGERYPRHQQWPSVAQRELGHGYEVIDEGLNGRTTVWEDPIEQYKCGKDYIIPCIKTHQPFDLLVIFLGVNDLKRRFSLSAYDIAEGARALVRLAKSAEDQFGGAAPSVMLIAPPPLGELSELASMFAGGVEKSERFGQEFARVASEESCFFLDAGEYVHASPKDGLHLEPDQLYKLGLAVARGIRECLE